MIGAIAGDIIGSVYEHSPTKRTDFALFPIGACFTDDTVLTIAIAESLVSGRSYAQSMENFYYKYPSVPYGARFHEWASSHDHKPYNSWGNGSAMRVSAVAYVHEDLEDVLEEAKRSAEVTHDHEEGIKGAQATACAIFMANRKHSKDQIRSEIISRFGYDLSRSIADIRPSYSCDLSCQHTVPEAITCFLESDSYESCIRNAVSLGGDADTMACISGSIAEPFYGGLPASIRENVLSRLDEEIIRVLIAFDKKFKTSNQALHSNPDSAVAPSGSVS